MDDLILSSDSETDGEAPGTTIYDSTSLIHSTRLRTIICTPWRVRVGTSDREEVQTRNFVYARLAMQDSLVRGEAPLVIHLQYPLVVAADGPQRSLGFDSMYAWLRVADQVVIYTDFQVTKGMQSQANLAATLGIPVLYRKVDDLDMDAEVQELHRVADSYASPAHAFASTKLGDQKLEEAEEVAECTRQMSKSLKRMFQPEEDAHVPWPLQMVRVGWKMWVANLFNIPYQVMSSL